MLTDTPFVPPHRKSNYYLENMIDLIDEPLDSRVVWHMNGDPISDGGQADMAVNLLLKYGCLPQTLYPESFSSSASSKMDGLLVSKLREFTTELRALKKSMLASGVAVASIDNAMRRRKDEMMATVYNILSICLGTPPKPDAEFTWEYYDRDGKFCSLTTTPKAFYRKYTGPNYFDESFSIVNDPRHAYDRLYTVDRLGNVAGGRPVLCGWHDGVQLVSSPTDMADSQMSMRRCTSSNKPSSPASRLTSPYFSDATLERFS